MAQSDSCSGLLQSGLCASETCQRQEDITLSAWDWDKASRKGKIDRYHDSSMDSERDMPRREISSDRGTDTSQRSSLTDTLYRRAMTIIPVEHTPTPVRSRTMSLRLLLSSSGSLVDEGGKPESQNLPDAPTSEKVSKSSFQPTESLPPPSPRSHIQFYRANNEQIPISKLSMPLDRFLAQQDDVTGFGDDPTWSEEDWQRLRSLRTSALRLRSQVKLKRRELYEKELAKSFADDAFIRYVREAYQNNSTKTISDMTLLTEKVEALQAARDIYGPVEYEYNALENLLDGTEFELAKFEARLYRTKETSLSALSVPEKSSLTNTPPPPPPPPISLLGLSSEDEKEEYHSLQSEYFDRLGDLDLARERLHDLGQEYDKLLWTQESRIRIGKELQEHERVFIAEYPARQRELHSEIMKIEEDVEQRRGKCIAEGLSLSEGSSSSDQGEQVEEDEVAADASSQLDHVSVKNEFSALSVPESSHNMFPILLPEPEGRNADLESLISDFDESNKANRIKRWMLHKLRTSPLELELLIRVSVQALKVLELRQWKAGIVDWEFCVLLYWERDEIGKLREDCNPQKTLTAVLDNTRMTPQSQEQELLGFRNADGKTEG